MTCKYYKYVMIGNVAIIYYSNKRNEDCNFYQEPLFEMMNDTEDVR